MVVVRITMNVLPEKKKELLQTLLSLIGPMEKEVGCLGYTAFCDIENQNLLTLLEEWQTRKHLDHHFRSERFGVLLGTRSLLSASHEIHIYTVYQSEGMEAIDAVRAAASKILKNRSDGPRRFNRES